MDRELTLATPQEEEAKIEQTEESSLNNEQTEQDNEQNDTGSDNDEQKYDLVWDNDEINEEDIFNEPTDYAEHNDEQEELDSKDNEQLETQNNDHNQTEDKKEKFILKHRGKEIEIDSIDELIALAQKGLDYEFKMSRIKPFRQAIDIIEKTGLELSDIKALADAKQGKKEALEYLANKYGIELGSDDIDDLFEEDEKNKEDYQPEIDSNVDPVKEIWEEYATSNPDKAGKVLSIWNELDPSFQQELWNPQTFQAFIGSVETGEFEQVYPKAIKIKALNPSISWIKAYLMASKDIIEPKEPKEPKQNVKRKETTKRSVVKNQYDDYDSVWNADIPLEELEKQIFNS